MSAGPTGIEAHLAVRHGLEASRRQPQTSEYPSKPKRPPEFKKHSKCPSKFKTETPHTVITILNTTQTPYESTKWLTLRD
jgi:hypothetical protein